MDTQRLRDLRDRLICPITGGPITWESDTLGRADSGVTATWDTNPTKNTAGKPAWIIRGPGLDEIPDEPEYTSSNPYHADALDLIDRHPDGLILNWGAGSPKFQFPNVLEAEIRRYPSTDLVTTAPRLPFADATFDGVISLSVLEHVRDPFEHAAEIRRVLKPGGELVLHAAFLQPYHGAPHHYFNLTASAYEPLLEGLDIQDLRVGAHQHPWITLRWYLDRTLSAMPSQADRDRLRAMPLGDLLDHLNTVEGAPRVQTARDPGARSPTRSRASTTRM